jgi:hypothetical protein
MEYADFTLETARRQLNLTVETERLFSDISPLAPSTWLVETLQKGGQLALISEKARSEFIVAPILLTVGESSGGRVTLHSGQRFDVDVSSGLSGECDFLLSAGEPVPVITGPIITLVEAKKNDVDSGLGQCGAQMVAAQRFHAQENHPERPIYGCVTTGEAWQFLKLDGSRLILDSDRHYIVDLEKLLGIFQVIITEALDTR